MFSPSFLESVANSKPLLHSASRSTKKVVSLSRLEKSSIKGDTQCQFEDLSLELKSAQTDSSPSKGLEKVVLEFTSSTQPLNEKVLNKKLVSKKLIDKFETKICSKQFEKSKRLPQFKKQVPHKLNDPTHS